MAIPVFIFAGRAWPYVALGVIGAVYPDAEKVLSVDFHLADRFILFNWHSGYLSNRTAGLPESVLIGLECLLIASFLLAMWRMKRAASGSEHLRFTWYGRRVNGGSSSALEARCNDGKTRR